MSYLSDASLVMIPSGVEAGTVFTSKPAGGSADLTFTRSNDTATRVGPNGYIEKVRTNLALYSQDFSQIGTWVPRNGTYTANAGTAPDGTNTATKVTATNIDPYIYQSISFNGVITASCYMKGIGSSIGKNAQVRIGAIPTTIALTSNWQRVSVTTTISGATICGVEVPDPAIIGDEALIWGFQVEAGTVATDYIPTTTAAVSVGPVANVPRINFDPVLPRTGSLLLEPQRTNGLAYSEYFGAWSLSGGTLTANAEVSPQGVENAYLYTEDTSTNYHRINTGASASSSNKVYSVYAKWAGGTANRWFTIDNGPTAWFDIVNGVVGGAQGSVVTSIEDCGNGWYRCIYHNPTSTTGGIYLGIASSDGGSGNHVGNGQPAFYIYGAQCEDNVTYPTSYIPTYGAAVTRGADVMDKEVSGISTLSSGTFFLEFERGLTTATARDASTDGLYYRSNTSFPSVNSIEVASDIDGSVRFAYRSNSVFNGIYSNNTLNQYKMLIKWNGTTAKAYVNGTQVFSDSLTFTSNLEYIGYNADFRKSINKFLIFPTEISDTDAITLTTL